MDEQQKQIRKAIMQLDSGIHNSELTTFLNVLATGMPMIDPAVFENVIPGSDSWNNIGQLIIYIYDRLEILSLVQPAKMFLHTCKDIECAINQLSREIKSICPELISLKKTSTYDTYPLDYQIPTEMLQTEFKAWKAKVKSIMVQINKAYYANHKQDVYKCICDLTILEINMLYLMQARSAD